MSRRRKYVFVLKDGTEIEFIPKDDQTVDIQFQYPFNKYNHHSMDIIDTIYSLYWDEIIRREWRKCHD